MDAFPSEEELHRHVQLSRVTVLRHEADGLLQVPDGDLEQVSLLQARGVSAPEPQEKYRQQ